MCVCVCVCVLVCLCALGRGRCTAGVIWVRTVTNQPYTVVYMSGSCPEPLQLSTTSLSIVNPVWCGCCSCSTSSLTNALLLQPHSFMFSSRLPNTFDPSHYRPRLLDASRYLLTLPGSPDQTLHADASLEAEDAAGLRLPTYAVNVYIPLVDLTESNGALQVIPGTHRGVREARYEGGGQQGEQGEQEPQEWQGAQGAQGRGEGVGGKAGEAGEQRQPPILMTVPAGSVVLYDFRLLHRGTMNQGDRRTTRRTANSDAAPAATASSTAAPHPPSLAGSRPVLYLTFARPWFTDKGEFSDESVWDAPT